jgi:hypothetical protein
MARYGRTAWATGMFRATGILGQWDVRAMGMSEQWGFLNSGVSEQWVFEPRGYHVLSMSADFDVFYRGSIREKTIQLTTETVHPFKRLVIYCRISRQLSPVLLNYNQSLPGPSPLRSALPHHSVLRTRQGYVCIPPYQKQKLQDPISATEKMAMGLFYRQQTELDMYIQYHKC